VEIVLASRTLDARGMVTDFHVIKEKIQTWIDKNFDHRFLLRGDDPILPTLRRFKEPVYLFKENPTAEVIAREIYLQAQKKGLPVERVTLWETDKSSATYGEA